MNAKFTRQMKKTHTILLPQMLEYHSAFLKAAFENDGYQFDVMHSESVNKEEALKYISSDYCYPTVLILSQFMEVIDKNLFDSNKIAFMEPQAGGSCRAGNIYNVIQKTLEKKGYPHIPVISLNAMGEEKQPGFNITPRLLFGAIAAVCYGDLMMCLYQQIKPYEQVKNQTDLVYSETEKYIVEQIKNNKRISKKNRINNYKYILGKFAEIGCSKEKKEKAGITGEIYMKFSSLGNNNIEKYIIDSGFEPKTAGFINYCLYLVDSEIFQTANYTNASVREKVCGWILNYLQKIQRELYAEIEKYGFEHDLEFEQLKNKADGIIDYGCNSGDGWLIAAETVFYIESGCENVLILHPFGCLVSHSCERGIMKNLHKKYPNINIQTIEYDYDSSDTLRDSRIMLALWNKDKE